MQLQSASMGLFGLLLMSLSQTGMLWLMRSRLHRERVSKLQELGSQTSRTSIKRELPAQP